MSGMRKTLDAVIGLNHALTEHSPDGDLADIYTFHEDTHTLRVPTGSPDRDHEAWKQAQQLIRNTWRAPRNHHETQILLTSIHPWAVLKTATYTPGQANITFVNAWGDPEENLTITLTDDFSGLQTLQAVGHQLRRVWGSREEIERFEDAIVAGFMEQEASH